MQPRTLRSAVLASRTPAAPDRRTSPAAPPVTPCLPPTNVAAPADPAPAASGPRTHSPPFSSPPVRPYLRRAIPNGMTRAARVQAKLNKVDGVAASVNLCTERAHITAPAHVSRPSPPAGNWSACRVRRDPSPGPLQSDYRTRVCHCPAQVSAHTRSTRSTRPAMPLGQGAAGSVWRAQQRACRCIKGQGSHSVLVRGDCGAGVRSRYHSRAPQDARK